MDDLADVFKQNRPAFEFAEAEEAAAAGRVIQSLGSHPLIGSDGKIIAMAIKRKLSSGTETVILGPHAASVLRMMIAHLEQNNWTELATLLPDATRQ
jgi:hypothetical protein